MSTNQRLRPDSALIYVINMEFLDHNGFTQTSPGGGFNLVQAVFKMA